MNQQNSNSHTNKNTNSYSPSNNKEVSPIFKFKEVDVTTPKKFNETEENYDEYTQYYNSTKYGDYQSGFGPYYNKTKSGNYSKYTKSVALKALGNGKILLLN